MGKMKFKKIVISGYYGSKNAGDEAMLSAMIEVLAEKRQALEIVVISADPTDTLNRHAHEKIKLSSVSWLAYREILDELKSASLLISGGGSLLQNVTSGRSLYYYLSVIFLARLVGTPVMLYAQGIGPVHGWLARSLMKFVNNMTTQITVRDIGSANELKNLAITKPNIEVTADPVLAIHEVDKTKGKMILQNCGVDLEKRIIGISVREWKNWPRYKHEIAKACEKMLTLYPEAQIVFLPMQYAEDVQVAQKVVSQIQASPTEKARIKILNQDFMTYELLSMVGNFDLLIGIRLHALIFAGVMHVPMVGLSYDPKIDGFLNSIGEKSVADLQTVTSETILQDVQEKFEHAEEFKQKNILMMNQLRKSAERNATLALQLLDGESHV